MSTTIYTGFRVNTTSMTDLLKLCRDFRPGVLEDSKEKYFKFFENMMKETKTPNKEAFEAAYDFYDELYKDAKQMRISAAVVGTDCNIVFFPSDYPDEEFSYGIFYGDEQKWFKRWLTQPGVSEFWYWNNTDEPEGMTYEEFAARGRIWDRLLPSSIPSMDGFNVEISDPHRIWRYDEQLCKRIRALITA